MVSVTPVRRPGGRSARVRAAVLEATLDELVEFGFADMTMQGIAARAGVNRTSLYRRWKTKGALLADALLVDSAEIANPPDTGDVRSDLLVLWATAPTERARRDFARPVAVSRALAAAAEDPDVTAAHQELWRRRLELISTVVNRAVARGELPPSADPELLMDLLFGPFLSRVVARDQRPSARFLSEVLESALRAVGAAAKNTSRLGPASSEPTESRMASRQVVGIRGR